MTAYDDVAYPSLPFPLTHPDSLAVSAALRGLAFAHPDRCRVLEIGCGEGGNLIPMALTLPESSFFGFDLAPSAIAEARKTVEALGLRNIRLEALDILEADPQALGQFDYIIVHGVYSWVPPAVREALLALIGATLAPDGIAFVSYNALPGWRLRQTLRDMMLWHVRGIQEPRERLAAGRALLEKLGEAYGFDKPTQVGLKFEIAGMLKRVPEVLLHDELGAFSEAFHLHEFLGAAGAHGLYYTADAEPTWLDEALTPSPEGQAAASLANGDPLELAQYKDFFSVRVFRQTLLRREPSLHAAVDADRVNGLFVAMAERSELSEPDAKTGEITLKTASGGAIRMGGARLLDLFQRLLAAWPAALPAADFDADFGQPLLQLWSRGVVDLTVAPSRFVSTPGERPLASPLARLQAAAGAPTVTTLKHTPIAVEDAVGRKFITLLDGTRTRADLLRAMAEATGAAPQAAEATLAASLAGVTRLPLLMA